MNLRRGACFVDVQQIAAFKQYLNGNLAREANRLHDWSGKLWNRRYRPISVSERDFTSVETLELSPIPAWAHLSRTEYRDRIRERLPKRSTGFFATVW